MYRVGIDEDELVAYRPELAEPEDFDALWAQTVDDVRRSTDVRGLRPVETGLEGVRTWDLVYGGYRDVGLRAWVTLPATHERGTPIPVVVEFPGYSSGRGRAVERILWAVAGYAHVTFDPRGQGGAFGSPGDSADPRGSAPAALGFMTRGIGAIHDYYYHDVYADAVALLECLRRVDIFQAEQLAVAGVSQGGGLALAVAGLVPEHVDAVMADVPFLCDIVRSMVVATRGPYLELVDYLAVHPGQERQVLRTLSYIDAASHGRRALAPALISIALRDTVCPPMGPSAAANWLGGEVSRVIYRYNDHEGGRSAQVERQIAWLRERLATKADRQRTSRD